jgi:REP element-mobilizing transposase RayT
MAKYDPQKHHRRSIRVNQYDYTQPGGYFITLVTLNRYCLFGNIMDGLMRLSDLGQIAFECWRAIPEHFPNVELGVFVVMPNHVHGIILITDGRGTIYRAPTTGDRAPTTGDRAPTTGDRAPTTGDRAPTTGDRAPTTEQFQKPIPGSIPTIVRTYKAAVTRRIGREHGLTNIWQRNYYEHVIRNNEELNRIHLYIESNPLNWYADDENPGKRR